MSLTKIRCPECDAALKSEDGFTPGEEVTCPKCDTAFAVPKPKAKAVLAEADEPAEAPKKKKKKAAASEDEPRSYKNSPLRYAILGVLVVVMIVLGVMLYLKKGTVEPEVANNDPPPNAQQPINIQPVQPQPKLPTFPTPKFPNPKVNPKQPGKQPSGGAGGGLLGNIDPLSPIFGGAPTPAQGKQIVAKYSAALVGSWASEAGGAKDEVAYLADGTFVASRTGPGAAKASGKYTVVGPAGSTGLKLKLETDAGTRTINVSFDGDALEHPTLEKGVTATFQRK